VVRRQVWCARSRVEYVAARQLRITNSQASIRRLPNVRSLENASADEMPVVVDLASFLVTHEAPVNAAVHVPKRSSAAAGAHEGLAKHTHLTELRDIVGRINEQLDRLHASQQYYATRIERHMLTNREVHWRALFYPSLEIVCTGGMAAVQLLVIHQLFARRAGRRGPKGV
jgi:emp24/gp25L/p24 family/GOLD